MTPTFKTESVCDSLFPSIVCFLHLLLEIRVILHGSITRKMIQVNDTHLLDPGERYHNVLPESGVSLFLIFVFFKYLSLMAMVVLNHFILPVLFLHFCTINLCAHLKMYTIYIACFCI